jgi:hypothetical protein
MRFSIIIFLLFLGCTKKHHFVYKESALTPKDWYEDLYECCAYPSPFCMTVASHDNDSAKSITEYFSKIYIPTTDNIKCTRSENQ